MAKSIKLLSSIKSSVESARKRGEAVRNGSTEKTEKPSRTLAQLALAGTVATVKGVGKAVGKTAKAVNHIPEYTSTATSVAVGVSAMAGDQLKAATSKVSSLVAEGYREAKAEPESEEK